MLEARNEQQRLTELAHANAIRGELYRLDFSNGKSYVGVSEVGSSVRYRGHAKCSRMGSQNLVHKAWRKYGAPKLTVVAILERSELLLSEQRAVRAFNTMFPNGYNMTSGGEASKIFCDVVRKKIGDANRNPSAETRKKMSEGAKRRLPSVPRAFFKGCKHSTESRRKISNFLVGNSYTLGHQLSDEHKEKIGAALRGKKQTSELIKKRADARRGKFWSEELKAKHRNARLERKAQ